MIVGCSPTVYNNIPAYELAHFESEVVILNIDHGTVKWKHPLFIQGFLHRQRGEMIIDKLREIAEIVDKKKEFLIDGYLDVDDDSSRSIKLQVMANLEINMKIKRIFVNFMIQILGNYQSFYTREGEFDYKGYIDQISENNVPFYECFTKTQLFNTFLKDSWKNEKFEIQEFKHYLSIIQATNK